MFIVRLRTIVKDIAFFIGAVLFFLFAFGVIAEVAHTHCPFSSICFGLFALHPSTQDAFFPLFTIAGFTLTIPIVFAVFTVASLFIGRFFCGWICPIGTLQEKIYNVVNRCERRFVQRIPYGLHRWLKWLKYLVLAAVAALAFFGLHRVYMGFCPVLALAHPAIIEWTGIAVLAVLVVGSIFVERIWCRYLCPYAALMNLFMHLGNWLHVPRLKVKRNVTTSLECRNCCNYCQMHINLEKVEVIDSAECILCQRCVRSCTKTKGGKDKCIYKTEKATQ